MQVGDAARIALATSIAVAVGCGLGESGELSTSTISDAASTPADEGTASGSEGGSGGFDVILGSSSSGGSWGGDASLSRDAGPEATDAANDAAGDGGPCATLAVCCQAIAVLSPPTAASCLQTAQDGGAAACSIEYGVLLSTTGCL